MYQNIRKKSDLVRRANLCKRTGVNFGVIGVKCKIVQDLTYFEALSSIMAMHMLT